MTPSGTGDRPRPVFSRFYAAISERMDDEGLGALRTELLSPLVGSVVEVGAGNGRNFGRYPGTVTAVTAIEPEPRLRELAARAAAIASVPVTVVGGWVSLMTTPWYG
jgi:SAM-dependent methyltransferase